MTSGPRYDRALAALQSAHEACFKHPERDLLGMNSGPFSGVNEALGIITLLESENGELRREIKRLQDEVAVLLDNSK